jgi:dienelactone hydrolase
LKLSTALTACVLLSFFLVGCGQAPDVPIASIDGVTFTLTPPAPMRVAPTREPTATVTLTVTSVPTMTPEPTLTLLPTVAPSATPDPYEAMTVDALAARAYGGGELQILETLERNEQFARYLIQYPSDGLNISGFINVPNEGSKFPVAIVLHGYIAPEEYETLAYTQRYADALVEAGYFVIHPNLRNFPPSDSGPNMFRIGMAIDVLNLIAIIQEQSQDPLGALRRAKGDDINLWGHSMGGGVALRVITVNNDEAIKTAVLYGAMSGDEVLKNQIIQELSEGRRGNNELEVAEETLAEISPINYLERINAAISIHHGDADEVVPLEWSEDLCLRLEKIGHPAECYTYHAAPHTFYGIWDDVFIDRFVGFMDRH